MGRFSAVSRAGRAGSEFNLASSQIGEFKTEQESLEEAKATQDVSSRRGSIRGGLLGALALTIATGGAASPTLLAAAAGAGAGIGSKRAQKKALAGDKGQIGIGKFNVTKDVARQKAFDTSITRRAGQDAIAAAKTAFALASFDPTSAKQFFSSVPRNLTELSAFGDQARGGLTNFVSRYGG